MTLKADRFGEFFEAVYGYEPFPWQERLAKRVFTGEWPRAIALPTAAGKTACIDVAVFSLACGAANAARRIFFVVDRRIVVDQAFEHAKNLAEKLKTSKTGIVAEVARALRDIAQDERPLDFYALRGGMYRETAWTRSPIQPTIITSTVDQVGSRLLFRGYGVSDSMKPVHAGLVGNDAIILLDEAHCARPFDQTMQAVEKYRKWGEGGGRPFHFVSITATPVSEVSDKQILRDSGDDRKHIVLGKRIKADKPTTLVVAEKAKGKNTRTELVKVLEQQARELANEFACVGIIVNRVATARILRESLQKDFGEDVVLLTGRMRPLDRDKLYETRLKPLLSNAEGTPPRFVVGTQCLECGADFDFHALVTECASLDALRQRFGRLNRVARRPSAKAAVVIAAGQAEDTSDDSVYGESLANTWKWLNTKATKGTFDFGVGAVSSIIQGDEVLSLNAPTSDAPVLFPAHLDCWVQTHPMPLPDPDPAVFLHGSVKPGQPDVQVVFRDDLGDKPERWGEIVSLLPPSSSEAVSVPISTFEDWLDGRDQRDKSGDVQGEIPEEETTKAETAPRAALSWRGAARSITIYGSQDVTANGVYVIPCSTGSSALGDFLSNVPADYAEQAFQKSRDKAALRLVDSKVNADTEDFDEAITAEIQSLLRKDSPEWLRIAVKALEVEKRREVEPHPLGGWVLTGKKRLKRYEPTYLEDSETDESFRGHEITLDDHSIGVANHANRFAAACGLPTDLYRSAGLFHDAGKLDRRFQAMLRRSSPQTIIGKPLAKSVRSPRTKEERDQAREVHRYPRGARHELLSAAIVATLTADDLLLHLIATHHGSARPFASHVNESERSYAEPFENRLFEMPFRLDSAAQAIDVWNATLGERFWRVVRKLGWWECAYWETVFRLADHAQSRREQDGPEDCDTNEEQVAALAPVGNFTRRPRTIALPGLSGSNPLAFLTALGTLRIASGLANDEVQLSWGANDQQGIAMLHLNGDVDLGDFVEWITKGLIADLRKHQASMALEWMSGETENLRQSLGRAVDHALPNRRDVLDWSAALFSETAPDATSQLMMVRRDYVKGNFEGVLRLTTPEHVRRALFETWDYADGLDNQSLHWEPTEDRRHAYQWHQPSGDPTRKKRGGMLGANRLALEAWPLFTSFAVNDKLSTRGFSGVRVGEVRWTWPLWSQPLNLDAVGSLLAARVLQANEPKAEELRSLGIFQAMRCSRILVGKTPNLTQAFAV